MLLKFKRNIAFILVLAILLGTLASIIPALPVSASEKPDGALGKDDR